MKIVLIRPPTVIADSELRPGAYRPRTRFDAALLRLKKNRARRVGQGAARGGHPPLPSSTH